MSVYEDEAWVGLSVAEAASAFDPASVIGLPYGRAFDAADDNGYSVRVAFDDGVAAMLTQDFNPKRINLNLVDGIVRCYSLG